MTERLYYTDSYRTTFDARVVRLDEQDGRSVAFLDRSAFYPTSGGQPFDTGRLGEASVVEVVETDAGDVGHLLDGPVDTGSSLTGSIDWNRRFDHMQQHTGQHVLSAAFARLLQAKTMSFHLGPRSSTIDLDRSLTLEACRTAEDEANRIVWSNRSVSVRFASAEEAAAMPLRKESARTGQLRLIDVLDFDRSACGGTHVAATGEIGVIALLGVERYKGGTRVEFVCGGRTLPAYRTLADAVAGSVQMLSVVPAELPDAISRLQTDNKSASRRMKALQTRLATFEAEILVRRASDLAGCRAVIETLDEFDAAGLKELAKVIGGHAGHVAVLLSARPPVLVAIASASDCHIDAGALVLSLTERFGGRGGGQRALAQAGGLDAPAERIATAARELIDNQ